MNLIQTKKLLVQCAVLPEFEGLRQVFKAQTIEHEEKGRMFFEMIEGEDAGTVCLLGGMGDERARASCEWALKHWRPMRVIDFGIAGALSLDLGIGDVVLSTRVKNEAGMSIDVESDLSVPAWKDFVVMGACRVTKGIVFSLDEAVVFDEMRARHHLESGGALAVSQETFAIAGVCVKNGMRFSSVRMISDCREDDVRALRSAEMLRKIRNAAEIVRLV